MVGSSVPNESRQKVGETDHDVYLQLGSTSALSHRLRRLVSLSQSLLQNLSRTALAGQTRRTAQTTLGVSECGTAGQTRSPAMGDATLGSVWLMQCDPLLVKCHSRSGHHY